MQFFFRVADYLRLVEDLGHLGVDKPVIPGIMPITNLKSVARMAELSGAAIPAEVTARIEAAAPDPEAVRSAGIEIADGAVPAAHRPGRPGAALLHDEPGERHGCHLREPRARAAPPLSARPAPRCRTYER